MSEPTRDELKAQLERGSADDLIPKRWSKEDDFFSGTPDGNYAEMQERIAALEAENERLTRHNELLRAIAARLEWNYPDGNSGNCCPICHRDERWRQHEEDCLYQTAIDDKRP